MHPFILYFGEIGDLPTTDNHLIYRWITDRDCKILFSVVEHGEALSIHLSSDKKGLPYLEQAVNEFCDYCFSFPKYKSIIGKINRPSIVNLAKKCGFKPVYEDKQQHVYVYERRR